MYYILVYYRYYVFILYVLYIYICIIDLYIYMQSPYERRETHMLNIKEAMTWYGSCTIEL